VSATQANRGPARIAACPQCGRSARLDAQNPWRPFCCERCRLVDLGAWFNGERAIPADAAPPADDPGTLR
jgi:endogenous inhibitor of DNA gyrase (YacG/DUF329 family)